MGGEFIGIPAGLSDASLREELLRMFDDSLRPKLKPVPVKCRQFLCNSSFQGKVRCSTHINGQSKKKNLEQSCKTKKESCSKFQVTENSTDGKCEDSNCWKFHLREFEQEETDEDAPTFAGCQSIIGPQDEIRSKAGTVRGVTNRVRAGIATFCGQRKPNENGVVVYISSLGIIRETFQQCLSVRTILNTLLVNYDEKDVFFNRMYQAELMELLDMDLIVVPQVFVKGQHLGDARDIDRLNESGQLRQIMKSHKKLNSFTPCDKCGNFKLLPCGICQGTKKSPRHCNPFTQEFAALRCMQCDERGLVKCKSCVNTRDT